MLLLHSTCSDYLLHQSQSIIYKCIYCYWHLNNKTKHQILQVYERRLGQLISVYPHRIIFLELFNYVKKVHFEAKVHLLKYTLNIYFYSRLHSSYNKKLDTK